MSASMTLGATLVSAGIATAVLTTGAGAPPPDRFTLGVLRRDGLVTPFATFDSKHWRNDWPKPLRHVDDVPVTLGSVPRWWWGRPGPRETWQASVGPGERAELHVTGANVYDAQCLQQIGLRTDYRPSAPPPGPGARPYPKDGLAVSPPYPVEPIEVLPIPSVVPRGVADAFNKANAKLTIDTKGPAAVLRLVPLPPITIEATYASGHDVSRLYYFEAIAHHNTADDPPLCESLSYGAGWFNVDARGQLRPISFEVAETSCDRAGLLYMLPLGVVRSGGRVFWIAQWSGWNFEQYNIVEIKPNGTEDVLRVPGGSCS
jgi:hypothetical protein